MSRKKKKKEKKMSVYPKARIKSFEKKNHFLRSGNV